MPTTEQPVDARQYRDVIGRFATGVAVVTTRTGDSDEGMTVNSLTSVSLEPTLLLVCLTRDSRTAVAVEGSGRFVVNLLAHRQKELSNRFARPGEDHFRGLALEDSRYGPVLPDVLGWLGCTVDRLLDGGDHVIVLGRVEACVAGGGDPLVFYRGRYARHVGYEDYPPENWWS